MADSTNPVENSGGGNSSDGATPVIPGIKPRKKRLPSVQISSNKYGVEAPRNSGDDKDFDRVEQAKFIGSAVVSLVELVDSMVAANCEGKIESKRPEKLGEFKEIARKFSLQEKDKEMIQDSAQKIAEKYDMLLKFGPEIVLCVVLAQYSARQIALIRFVNKATIDKPKDTATISS